MVDRVFNFSPGPAMLPLEVMQQAQCEFLDWQGVGSSIMELSHRGAHFKDVAYRAEQSLRHLLSVPENYHILFLQGGAQLQNAAVPMNILGDATSANYLVSGLWSEKSAQEAHKYTDVVLTANMKDCGYTTVAPPDQWQLDSAAGYFYYCDNETVHGIEFPDIPDVTVPLVVDMSSNLLTRSVDVSRFGVIFACAQKNLGPSGVTIVIVRDDLLKREVKPYTPSVINYKLQVTKESMLNTPPTFAWYMAGLVFDWTQQQGGVEVMNQRAQERSQFVYDYLDSSDFYHCPVDPEYRSRINVVFDLKNTALNEEFLTASEQENLYYLNGHSARGGMRASMYNAMPLEGAKGLVEFLELFEKNNKP